MSRQFTLMVMTRVGALVCGLLCADARTALCADGQDEPAVDGSAAAARQRVVAGGEKLEQGDHVGALTDFRMADAVLRAPSSRLGVARALAGLGRLVEARDTAQSVSMIPIPEEMSAAEAKNREDATALSYELEQRIGRLRLVLPPGAPAYALLFLDDKPLSQERVGDIDVDPGEHTVRATADGYRPFSKSATFKEGGRQAIIVNLVAIPVPKPIIRPGPPKEVEMEVAVGPVSWTGFGLAAAGLIAGTVAGAITLDLALPNGTNCPPPYWDKRKRALTASYVSTGGFVAAGVGAGVALLGLFVFDMQPVEAQPDKDTVPVAVTPLVGPGFVGLRGAF